MLQIVTWRLLTRQSSYASSLRRQRFSFSCRLSIDGEASFTPFHSRPTLYDAGLFEMNKSSWKAVKEQKGKRRKVEGSPAREGTSDDVLAFEVQELLKAEQLGKKSLSDLERKRTDRTSAEIHTASSHEIQLEVKELSSTGDGLALSDAGDHVFVVPFTVPGDIIRANVFPQKETGKLYSRTDLIEVVEPSSARDDSQIQCKYFGTCSGCQLQMLPYEAQLVHKKTIVEKAFRHFSGLPPELVPAVGDTIGSPLKYGYRTKLTPHFDGPPRKDGRRVGFTEVPPIGYAMKGRKKVIDIENCPIGTDIVQEGFKRERKRVAENIHMYKNGATLLLRESTQRSPNQSTKVEPDADGSTTSTESAIKDLTKGESGEPILRLTYPTHIDVKTYTNDMNGMCTEYIDDWVFTSRAGSFFQNNNSILSTFTAFVRDHALPPPSSEPPLKYLLDAYCGSGLFTITLSTIFRSALGIDVDPQGIAMARANAAANKLENAGFIQGDASDLFADVPFPPDQTLVVIDPPRKGASEDFLLQLLRFGPRRVVYVSCNVHTQARDAGILVRGNGKWKYQIESLRGFDFFPQTGHVEGVAVLNRTEAGGTEQVDSGGKT